MAQLSLHFSTEEFACRHCGQCDVNPALIVALEHLRLLAGAGIVVLDGYRCAVHNAQVPTAAHGSFHVAGAAADIRIEGKTLQEMYALAEQVPEFDLGGIGIYDGDFIHVDIRKGYPHGSRWARVHGQYTTIPLSQLLPAGVL